MLSAYFFNDGEILVPSDVWEMGTEGTGRAPTIKRDKTVRATSKYVIPSGTKCSRVKFPRWNGEMSLTFKRQKGCVARVSNLAEASLSSKLIYCNNLIIDERYPSGGSFDYAQDDKIA